MTDPQAPTWSAPVRYAEVDQQGIVFNAHYLVYCEEALEVFLDRLGLGSAADNVRLVTSTLTWSGPARHGDIVDVVVGCERIGRTSLVITFTIRAGGRPCCQVDTTYVLTDDAGTPTPLPPEFRAALGGG